MVRIAQNDFISDIFQIIRSEALYAAQGAYGHKYRSVYLSVPGLQYSGPGPGVAVMDDEFFVVHILLLIAVVV